jgi:hypothetical protein
VSGRAFFSGQIFKKSGCGQIVNRAWLAAGIDDLQGNPFRLPAGGVAGVDQGTAIDVSDGIVFGLKRRHDGDLGSAGDEFRVDRDAVDDQVAVEQEVLARMVSS